jgi:putative transposase
LLHNRNKRQRYLKRWYRYYSEGKRFVYVDESGFAPSAERQHGWAARGEKVYGLRSGNRRPRTSLIAALIEKKLAAPMLFDGTTNTAIFNQWLEEMLCPLLNKNDVVVMDNAAFHKSQRTAEIIAATGATLLFLPPYSPDIMPIEKTFGTLKRYRQYNNHLSLDQCLCNYLFK